MKAHNSAYSLGELNDGEACHALLAHVGQEALLPVLEQLPQAVRGPDQAAHAFRAELELGRRLVQH